MVENTRLSSEGKSRRNIDEQHALASAIPLKVLAYFNRVVFFKGKLLAPSDERRLTELGFDIRPRDKPDDDAWFTPFSYKLSINCPSHEAFSGVVRIRGRAAIFRRGRARWHLCQRPGISVSGHCGDYRATVSNRRCRHREGYDTLHRTEEEGTFLRLVAAYADKPSKVTNEDNCVHIEHRCVGLPTLRNGIETVRDMLAFDHAAHWRKLLSRLFLHIDYERYGRIHNNEMKGIKRRHAKITMIGGRVPYNFDARRGGMLYRKLSLNKEETFRTMQRFIQQVGRDPRFVIPIPVDCILDRITTDVTPLMIIDKVDYRQGFPHFIRKAFSPWEKSRIKDTYPIHHRFREEISDEINTKDFNIKETEPT
jgi:hypothetical protein